MNEDGTVAVQQVGEPLAHVGRDVRVDEGDLLDAKQSAEIWITAAQSLFALAVLVDFNISVREAILLLVLFISQVVLEFLIIRGVAVPLTSRELLLGYTVVYVAAALGLFVRRRHSVRLLFGRVTETVRSALN